MSARSRPVRCRSVTTGSPIWLLAVAVTVAAVAAPVPARSVDAAPCWFPPVTGTVIDPFREPPCPWCAGNRGLDYRIGADVTVRVAASGRVEFVGVVADVRYVVIRLANGWRHTYGQLVSTSTQLGDLALAGAPIGRASRTFFFGLRFGDDYTDPAPFIGALRGRPRLVPVDGRAARPAPPARPSCRSLTAPPRPDRPRPAMSEHTRSARFAHHQVT